MKSKLESNCLKHSIFFLMKRTKEKYEGGEMVVAHEGFTFGQFFQLFPSKEGEIFFWKSDPPWIGSLLVGSFVRYWWQIGIWTDKCWGEGKEKRKRCCLVLPFSRARPPLDTGQAIPPSLPSPSRPPDDKPKKIIVSRYTHPMNIHMTSVGEQRSSKNCDCDGFGCGEIVVGDAFSFLNLKKLHHLSFY